MNMMKLMRKGGEDDDEGNARDGDECDSEERLKNE